MVEQEPVILKTYNLKQTFELMLHVQYIFAYFTFGCMILSLTAKLVSMDKTRPFFYSWRWWLFLYEGFF